VVIVLKPIMKVAQTIASFSVVLGYEVHLENKCDGPLVVTGADGHPTLGVIQPGASMSQTPSGASGRYQVYRSESDIAGPPKYGLFEVTVCYGGQLCSNPSNVDLFTIPTTIRCAQTGRVTGCINNPSASDVQSAMNSCPTARPDFGSVSDSKYCYSPGYACAVHPDAPSCQRSASAPIQRSMQRFGGSDTSFNAYACAGSFAQNPRGCASVNRGVSNPEADPSTFYQAEENGVPLYNEYSKWVHDLCGPDNYAFPYDDVGKHGGYQQCSGDVTVTFCGGGGGPSPHPPPTPGPPPVPSPTPTPGTWVPCVSGACCNPHTAVTQYCPGNIACQECGGGDACQCPSNTLVV